MLFYNKNPGQTKLQCFQEIMISKINVWDLSSIKAGLVSVMLIKTPDSGSWRQVALWGRCYMKQKKNPEKQNSFCPLGASSGVCWQLQVDSWRLKWVLPAGKYPPDCMQILSDFSSVRSVGQIKRTSWTNLLKHLNWWVGFSRITEGFWMTQVVRSDWVHTHLLLLKL